jgi:hypothetical protein
MRREREVEFEQLCEGALLAARSGRRGSLCGADDLRSFSINSPALVHEIAVISGKEHREAI